MKYAVTINKRARYIRVYKVIKRIGEQQNAVTRLFMKIFNPKAKNKNELKEPL
jgi:hypothetical protein